MKKRVLVIDDDQGISEVIKIVLEDNGFSADIIFDARNIVKKVTAIKPDLILLDIWMAGVDGRDVIKLLRDDGDTSAIPIVVISALTNTEKIATDAGADNFLSKPFDIDDLLSMAHRYT